MTLTVPPLGFCHDNLAVSLGRPAGLLLGLAVLLLAFAVLGTVALEHSGWRT